MTGRPCVAASNPPSPKPSDRDNETKQCPSVCSPSMKLSGRSSSAITPMRGGGRPSSPAARAMIAADDRGLRRGRAPETPDRRMGCSRLVLTTSATRSSWREAAHEAVDECAEAFARGPGVDRVEHGVVRAGCRGISPVRRGARAAAGAASRDRDAGPPSRREGAPAPRAAPPRCARTARRDDPSGQATEPIFRMIVSVSQVPTPTWRTPAAGLRCSSQ